MRRTSVKGVWVCDEFRVRMTHLPSHLIHFSCRRSSFASSSILGQAAGGGLRAVSIPTKVQGLKNRVLSMGFGFAEFRTAQAAAEALTRLQGWFCLCGCGNVLLAQGSVVLCCDYE